MLLELFKGNTAPGLHIVIASLYGSNLFLERFGLRFEISLYRVLQRGGWRLTVRMRELFKLLKLDLKLRIQRNSFNEGGSPLLSRLSS